MVRVGIVVPQGWTGEYDGWPADRAWARTVAAARQAERLGFESVWLYDHLQTTPVPTDEITFEVLTSLAALAASTTRVRLGQLVLCAGYRNPALVAKMIGTLDVISGGRVDLGIGAGWKDDEWAAYGWGFPPLKERMAILADSLEVLTRMLGPGRARFEGTHAHVSDAINVPKGLQSPRVPIVVGGNGPNVTWRLAARYADEVNLDGMGADDAARAVAVIRARCEEIGRDPATLAISCHLPRGSAGRGGQRRRDELARCAEAGLSRVMVMPRQSATSDEVLEELAADARAAGAELAA